MKIKLDVRGYAGPHVRIDPKSIVWPNKVLTFTGPHSAPSGTYWEAISQVHETRRWMATLVRTTSDGIVIYRVPRVAFWRKPAGWSADIRRSPEGKLTLVGICAIPRMRVLPGPAEIG